MGDCLPEKSPDAVYSVVLHAGAAESWFGDSATYRRTINFLETIIKLASTSLRNGGTAVDVVTEIVSKLEDYPQFNAGKGAAVNVEGFHELEAGIIDGRNCEYRAAACLQRTKNPIRLAKAMLSQESPAFIVGAPGDTLAAKNGLDMVDNSYFATPSRMQYWEKNVDEVKASSEYHGTVGAVALDMYGNLAAANSTGGLMFKSVGRIGDTAIAGAGLYADDQVAIACSGSGEAILKSTVAGRTAGNFQNDLSQDLGNSVQRALLKSTDLFPTSSCGVIAVDVNGVISIHCNSRIFAVASASSLNHSEGSADIIPSTIPVLNQLIFYEDALLKAGMMKYPTLPNQVMIELKAAPSFKTLELDYLKLYFHTLRRIMFEMQKTFGVEHVGFITKGGRHSILSPLPPTVKNGISRRNTIVSPELENTLCIKTMLLLPGYRALFFASEPNSQTLDRIEIHSLASSSSDVVSLPTTKFCDLCLAIWNILQDFQDDFSKNSDELVIEIDQQSNSSVFACISGTKTEKLHFPSPAPFFAEHPGYLSFELGKRAENLVQLQGVATRLAEVIKKSVIL